MKKTLLTLLALLCTVTLGAQGMTLQDTKEDSIINVVAYFCKNDTTVYTSTSKKWQVADGDTTAVYRMEEKFRLVVTDSTSNGYKLEYTPISHAYEGEADGADSTLMNTLWELTKDIRAIFVTDELGTIQHLENWREIRDVIKKGITVAFDALYTDNPGMDSIMPRKRFESFMMLKFNGEASIIAAYEEMGTLFGLHGRQLNIGTTDTDDNSSYPSHIHVTAGYEDYPDEEHAFEGDFCMTGTSVTTISNEEAGELMGTVMGMLLENGVANKANQAMKGAVKGDLTVTNLEDYHYFFNGWPRLMRTQKIAKVMQFQQVEENTIEWDEHTWHAYGGNDTEGQNQF